MLIDPERLVADFGSAAGACGIVGWPCPVRTEVIRAPQGRQPVLPPGMGAVYVFALSEDSGARTPAGPGAVLKVGRVGANSGPRFSSQHYSPRSAGSSLAKSLLRYRVMWPWLGITSLDEATVRAWMMQNLDRAHFFLPGEHREVIAELEVFVRARVGSVFEGAA